MSALVELFKNLATRISDEVAPVAVTRRYMPRYDAEDLVALAISVYAETSAIDEVVRDVVINETYTFGIAVQQAVAPQVDLDADGNPVLDGADNLAAGDAVLDQVEALKDLWRPGGVLRDERIADCDFIELTHEPIFEPIHLAAVGVYSAILDVTYRFSKI